LRLCSVWVTEKSANHRTAHSLAGILMD